MRSARVRDRRSAGAGSCACLAALVAYLCLAAPSGAQPSVEVDRGVLDSLGPAPPAKKPAARPPTAKASPAPPKKNEAAAVSKPVAPPPPPKLAPPPSPAAALPPPSPPAEPPQAEPATPPASDFVVRPVPPPPPLPHARRAPEAPSIAATAALAPSRSTQGETARIAFAGDDIEFSPEARRDLDALAVRLTDNERLHVDLLGYAAATSEPSQSRRLSLSRALAVRSYLVGRGIKSNRVDVRALGNRVEGTPADRVDVVVAER